MRKQRECSKCDKNDRHSNDVVANVHSWQEEEEEGGPHACTRGGGRRYLCSETEALWECG